MKHRIKEGECVVTHTDEERKALGFDTNLGGAELYCTSTALLKFDNVRGLGLREISYADFMARENTSDFNEASELREAGKKLLAESRKAMDVPKEQSYNTTGAPAENFLLASLRADVKRMLEIAEAKNHDYGGKDSNAFANFMAVEHLGAASAEAGITVRMTDKLSRIITLLNKEAKVADESITDTLLDLANYALILKALIAYKKQPVGTAVH